MGFRVLPLSRLVWILVGLAALTLLAGWYLILRPVVLRVPDELPPDFPEAGFSHEAFEELLERFVEDGRVHYDAWHRDAAAVRQLDRYLAAVARYSPHNAPARFTSRPGQLAYWLNAYNACVIKGVLANWPIRSVRDVKAPIELKAGMGFFWRLHFVLGGETMSLYHLENKIIRDSFSDPRVHFILNCASGGCPALGADVPEGNDMEKQLAAATREFLDTRVQVDDERKRIIVSPIFEWYRDDFLADVIRRGASPRTIAQWIRMQGVDLPDYEVEFADYDWNINLAPSR